MNLNIYGMNLFLTNDSIACTVEGFVGGREPSKYSHHIPPCQSRYSEYWYSQPKVFWNTRFSASLAEGQQKYNLAMPHCASIVL